jgi:phage shock protein A
MIIEKIWQALGAQINRIANFFWQADPIAQLQYEYDDMVDQLKEGRQGLEQYRALVESVSGQVTRQKQQILSIEAKIRAYLAAGDRDTAAHFALELQAAKANLAENQAQLAVHDGTYNNVLLKIQHASRKLIQVRDKIQKYDSDLRMSRAEAELAKVLQGIHVEVSGDFGQVEEAIQNEIDRNRAKMKVAADLSGEGLAEVRHEEAAEKIMADDALRAFEASQAVAEPTVDRQRAVVQQSG